MKNLKKNLKKTTFKIDDDIIIAVMKQSPSVKKEQIKKLLSGFDFLDFVPVQVGKSCFLLRFTKEEVPKKITTGDFWEMMPTIHFELKKGEPELIEEYGSISELSFIVSHNDLIML